MKPSPIESKQKESLRIAGEALLKCNEHKRLHLWPASNRLLLAAVEALYAYCLTHQNEHGSDKE